MLSLALDKYKHHPPDLKKNEIFMSLVALTLGNNYMLMLAYINLHAVKYKYF